MTRIGDELEREWHAIRGHLPHYHQPQDPTPEVPVTLLATIKADFAAIGHDLSAEGEAILHRHLGLANIAAHVANEAAALQDSTWVQLGEKYAGLPPAWIATAEHVLDTVAADLGTLTQPAPAEAPAEPDVPGDPGQPAELEPVPGPAGPVIAGQA